MILSFAVLYSVAAAAVAAWMNRRFAEATALIRTSFAAAASLAAAALGSQSMAIWGAIWECVRIGNDHFGSFRAARSPAATHLGAFFAAGVLLFRTIALVYAAVGSRRAAVPDAIRSD